MRFLMDGMTKPSWSQDEYHHFAASRQRTRQRIEASAEAGSCSCPAFSSPCGGRSVISTHNQHLKTILMLNASETSGTYHTQATAAKTSRTKRFGMSHSHTILDFGPRMSQHVLYVCEA
jgi:hypothetical protein